MPNTVEIGVRVTNANQASNELRKVASDATKLQRGLPALGRGFLAASGQSGVLSTELGVLSTGLGSVGLAATGAAIGVGVLAAGLTSTLKASIDFEAAIVKVAKTTGFTKRETEEFSDAILEMSRRMPVAISDLTEIAAVAGQLGISGPRNIAAFTEEVAKLASTTGVAATELAVSLGTIAQVSRLPIEEIGRLSAAITELGNTSNSTEAQILDITTRLVGIGAALDVPLAALTGISSAVASVTGDIEASATAVQRTFIGIFDAAQKGGAELQVFADIAGVTTDEFAALAKEHPEQAFAAFVEGLEDVENITAALDALGLSDVRVTKTLLALAQSAVPVSQSIGDANRAALEAKATNEEYARAAETTSAKLQLLGNNAKVLAIEVGNALKPSLDAVLDVLNALFGAFQESAAAAESLRNAIRLLLNPIGLARDTITDFGDTWGDTWNAMNDTVETAVNSILIAIEALVHGLGSGVSQLRDFADNIPFVGQAIDAAGLGDLERRLRDFEIGRVSIGDIGSPGVADIGDPAFGVARQREALRRERLADGPKRTIPIPDGGAAAKSVRTVLDALSDGVIDLGEAIEFGLSDAQVVTLELTKAEADLEAQRFRERIGLLTLVRAFPGLDGAQIRYVLGLKAIQRHLEETGKTVEQFLRDVNAGVLETASNAIDQLLGAPTRESLTLQLREKELERKRLLLEQGGAEDDDPRLRRIDNELAAIQTTIALRNNEIEQLRLRAQLADQTIRTDVELINAFTWLYGVVGNFSGALQQATVFLQDFASAGGAPMAQAAGGMPYVPRTMPVMVHEGERILTARENRQLGAGAPAVTFAQHFTVNADMSAGAMANLARHVEQANDRSLRRWRGSVLGGRGTN